MSNHSLLTHEDVVSAPIENGDAGVILKLDGSFRVFSTATLGSADLTPAQRSQGEKLIALSIALKHPEVMEILMQMSKDPDIVGKGIDLGSIN